MNPGKKNSDLLKNTGIHFLEFALGFLSLAKCHYQPSQDMKVNSLPFFALIALDSWADQDYTMSELADKLSITKQQLSHMIKVLEERGLVERIHDTANRRRVYIRICDSGREMMNQMKQEMLSSTLFGLRAYTPEELASMDECLCRLMELMEKFNCETDESVKNVSV
ncbi:MarR family winged helix-turn-helix transcriptional regulator [Clostridium sp.]|uniref:MarR family winged helix-turn-helix transcriptional regulator n=1 Tax=Clostridium sp. TaxID=1506 RepID=UPI002E7A78C0|nr:MarR family transcriptional regulator [Clostridium sp.]MEE0131884.1 MarR family transcriptional regulator [Clostridium sp.]